jgi:uncharacterized protein
VNRRFFLLIRAGINFSTENQISYIMIHPDTELRYINDKIGYGVVATKLIKKGTITWALDDLDREFTPKEIKKMKPVYQQIIDIYSYRNKKGNFVLCWDISRFVNHSFNPSCFTTAYDFEIAIRDIHPGEELTDDYGYLNLTEPFEAASEGTKRKVVYPDDLLKYWKEWDQKVLKGLKNTAKLAQPLKQFVSKKNWTKVENVIAGKEKMDSVLTCYYDDKKKRSRS